MDVMPMGYGVWQLQHVINFGGKTIKPSSTSYSIFTWTQPDLNFLFQYLMVF